MNQVERITYYENLLNESKAVLSEYDRALEAYISVQKKLTELEKYYVSPEWKEDFEASEKGELPKDLRCGVLSEDGIDHVLGDNLDLFVETRSIAERVAKK